MNHNKTIDTHVKVNKVSYPFSALVRVASKIFKTFCHIKVVELNQIPSQPYILICSHASYVDFCAAIEATKPNHPYWICSVEEFYDKNFALERMGVIPKRKFTSDPRCVENYVDILKERKKVLIIYPEARYSFVGHPERIDDGIAALAKMCDVPILYLRCNGSYLWSPQWGDRTFRHVSKILAEMKTIVTQQQVREMSIEQINTAINDNFKYDDEKYQLDNNIKVNYAKRAEGLHRILYKCPHCGTEFMMSSKGELLTCDHCGVTYKLNENGTLSCVNQETKFSKISDWYYWEKQEVKKEVESGKFFFEDDVKLEFLKGVGVGFVPKEGHYHMVCDYNGITVTGDDGFKYFRSSSQSYAIHIEYNYKKRGDAIDLSTTTETYFAFPINSKNVITKIHFAVEHIYDMQKGKSNKIEQ